ncbi:hypothetical protein [uncultured Maribacter sp.]|uniref:hypothetical protein n=1 Tax=uncultured Maribacter sp. TaxID=431308 RepID=UPI002614143D|nr:hypothetical protein [uncultured Maribacter sp.]
MNVEDFTYLLKNPNKVVNPVQTNQLEEILEEYPYFQAARALHLKGLKNLNSYKYNNALKITAAYTTDRDVLFNFITSKDFLQKSKGASTTLKNTEIADLNVSAEEIKVPIKEIPLIEESQDKPLPQDKEDANQILDPALFKAKEKDVSLTDSNTEISEVSKKPEDDLDIGSPLPFNQKEKHSFAEWLQLTSFKEISRKPKATEKAPPINHSKKNKFDRIDEFIAKKPKIIPQKELTEKIDIKASVTLDKNELMTQTLAKVYLEQKKYKKAIQAYKILSLKYPEKSSFFADRIQAVEKLQQDNNKA